MIKVLVVGQIPPPLGGQAIMIEQLLRGTFSHVQLYHVRMAFSSDMDEIGRFRFHKILRLFGLVFQIIWKRIRFGTTVLYYPPAGPNRIPMYRDIFILLATRWLFKQTVFHFHAGGISEVLPHLSRSEKFLFRKAYFNPDCSIRPSKFNPPDGKNLKTGLDVVIEHGIPDVYPDFMAQSVKKINKEPRILFAGVLCESKGILILLEACRMLKQNGFPFCLDMMGRFASSDFEKQVLSFIEKYNLSDQINLLGVKTGDGKWRIYSQADIFCFPTFFESESFGLVVLEAMQFFLPVVASRWRGIPSLVRDGETGYLVPVRDTKSLADRLSILLKDDKKRLLMGKHGRQVFLQEFRVERWYDQMEKIFITVAEQTERNRLPEDSD